MAEHNELGKIGEQLAIDYLLKNGYKIRERNYRYLKAEVDIIALKENTLVAVEVKTRTSNYFGNPEDFVTKKKIIYGKAALAKPCGAVFVVPHLAALWPL